MSKYPQLTPEEMEAAKARGTSITRGFIDPGFLLPLHLVAAVPMAMEEIRKRNGPTEWEVEEAQRRLRTYRASGEGEQFLFSKGFKQGETARAIGLLVECLAIMALYSPGGVRAFGMHFNAPKSEEVKMSDTVIMPAQELARLQRIEQAALAVYGRLAYLDNEEELTAETAKLLELLREGFTEQKNG